MSIYCKWKVHFDPKCELTMFWKKVSRNFQVLFLLYFIKVKYREIQKILFNPLVPGDFFLSNFLMKIGGKVHCMKRLGNLKVESWHSIFDHARGKKKSVLQNTGGLNPQLHLLNYDFKKHNIMKKKTFSFCAYFLSFCIILHVLSKKNFLLHKHIR